MSNLPVASSLVELGQTRVQRQANRQLQLAQAQSATIALTEASKVEAIADVTEIALISTSHVSAIESLLKARTPHADERLRVIAEAGCAGMADIVFRMSRKA